MHDKEIDYKEKGDISDWKKVSTDKRNQDKILNIE
jgi:hypothetical protein